MHEDCYGISRRTSGSLCRHPDPMGCCAVPSTTPKMHQIPNVDHDRAWNGAGTDPCAIHLLDFEAAQVVLRIDEERSFFWSGICWCSLHPGNRENYFILYLEEKCQAAIISVDATSCDRSFHSSFLPSQSGIVEQTDGCGIRVG